jgi:hypothetical protein
MSMSTTEETIYAKSLIMFAVKIRSPDTNPLTWKYEKYSIKINYTMNSFSFEVFLMSNI